jgi:predicted DNA-binding transcriptional regulator AlpA
MNSTLSEAQATAESGLSASTFARRRRDGTGPAYMKIGRRIVYMRDAFEAWRSSLTRT